MKIVLASNSPRRKKLLAKITKDFEIIPSFAPEVSSATDPQQYATELACHKATDVWQRHITDSSTVVIGCDTVVDFQGKILGKPISKQNAVEILQLLSGKTHLVHTGVCVIYQNEKHCFCETSSVTFRNLSARDIAQYVDSGNAMDKAGAYGIQECDFVAEYDGSYDNIMGFPTDRVAELLRELLS